MIPASPSQSQRKKKKKCTRRFSNEQIRSLESLFKLEEKVEPRKKVEMARELGLEPHQVAIWFQNKRARWKSKQTEQEYKSLKAGYDELNSRVESLKDEKHFLLIQLKKLSNELKTPSDDGRGSNGDTDSANMIMYSDDDEKRKTSGYVAETEEAKFQSMGEQLDDFSEPEAPVCTFNSDGLVDDQPCSSNWWDFWS